jgi:hypothetical protein
MSDLSLEFQIADAVAYELNNAALRIPVMARRTVLPQYKLSELDNYVVSVVPRAIPEEERAMRNGTHQVLVRVDVYVQKRVKNTPGVDGGLPDQAEVEAICKYTEELALAMRLRQLTLMPDVKYQRKERPEIYDMDMLRNMNVCTCPILLYYWARQ